jgi:hypothetical protein
MSYSGSTVLTNTRTCRVERTCIHLVALRVQYWLLSNGCAAILAWDYFVNTIVGSLETEWEENRGFRHSGITSFRSCD